MFFFFEISHVFGDEFLGHVIKKGEVAYQVIDICEEQLEGSCLAKVTYDLFLYFFVFLGADLSL